MDFVKDLKKKNQQQQNPVYMFVIISINVLDVATIISFTQSTHKGVN